MNNKTFTNIKVQIYNDDLPHNFTVQFYADGRLQDSEHIFLEHDEDYTHSRIFTINDKMNASFIVLMDDRTFDVMTYDFH